MVERARAGADSVVGDRIRTGSLSKTVAPFVLSDPPAVIAPFSVEGRWGAIAVASPDATDFGDRELELLGGLAHQAKLAIANASSFEGLERTFLSTVEALANALEARDEYTSSHARWITDTALLVGQELEILGHDRVYEQAVLAIEELLAGPHQSQPPAMPTPSVKDGRAAEGR